MTYLEQLAEAQQRLDTLLAIGGAMEAMGIDPEDLDDLRPVEPDEGGGAP